MKRVHRWALRAAAGAVLVLSLTGPAPGNVGGCGSTVQVASPQQFCTDRKFWECRRDQFAGRIDDATYNACIAAIESQCSGFAWPAECFPTQAQADGCVLLLQRVDLATLSTPDLLAMYTDCNLCM